MKKAKKMLSNPKFKNLKDDLDKLDGNPPHNKPSNPCINDGYYARSLEEKYGMTIEDMRKIVKVFS